MPCQKMVAADAYLLSLYFNGGTHQRQYRDRDAGSGFGGVDAEVGSYLAERYILGLRL